MLKLSCTGFIIGEDPLKLGKCRGETTGVHIKNLTSLDSFGKQPDRQGSSIYCGITCHKHIK